MEMSVPMILVMKKLDVFIKHMIVMMVTNVLKITATKQQDAIMKP
jgi:hypothetical protein